MNGFHFFLKWFIYDLDTISIYDFLWAQIVVMFFLMVLGTTGKVTYVFLKMVLDIYVFFL